MAENDELTWIAAARRGDRNAFGRLVQAYQVPVYNLTYRMLGNTGEAEDAAQETFLKAYARLNTYQPDMKFSNWILAIASHHCVDRLRRRRFTWVPVDDNPALEWLSDDGEQPDAAVLRSERAAEIQRLVSKLDPDYRAPIVLRYWYDLSYKEIADILNISESALKSRLHRARLQLAEAYDGQHTEERRKSTASSQAEEPVSPRTGLRAAVLRAGAAQG